MAASNQIVPAGGINHVGMDYISPQTAASRTIIQDAATGATEWAAFDHPNQALDIDTITEFTSAAGVTIDGLLVKDGAPRPANQTYYLGIDNAGTGTVNMFKVNASDQIECGGTLLETSLTLSQPLQLARGGVGGTTQSAAQSTLGVPQGSNSVSTWSPTMTGSGSMTVTGQTIYEANYCAIGPYIFFEFSATFTIGGTPDTLVQIPEPVAGNDHNANCGFTCSAVDGDGTVMSSGFWRNQSGNIIVFLPSVANWSAGSGGLIHIQGQYEAT